MSPFSDVMTLSGEAIGEIVEEIVQHEIQVEQHVLEKLTKFHDVSIEGLMEICKDTKNHHVFASGLEKYKQSEREVEKARFGYGFC